MKNSFIKQFKAELWSNEVTIKAIRESKEPDERVFKLMGHLVASHHIWLNRIQNQQPQFGSWDIVSLDECEELARTNCNNWLNFIQDAGSETFNTEIEFNFFGVDSIITIEDVMIHLINHSSYHRGQIIASLKGKLEPLPLTTYIAFAKITK